MKISCDLRTEDIIYPCNINLVCIHEKRDHSELFEFPYETNLFKEHNAYTQVFLLWESFILLADGLFKCTAVLLSRKHQMEPPCRRALAFYISDCLIVNKGASPSPQFRTVWMKYLSVRVPRRDSGASEKSITVTPVSPLPWSSFLCPFKAQSKESPIYKSLKATLQNQPKV